MNGEDQQRAPHAPCDSPPLVYVPTTTTLNVRILLPYKDNFEHTYCIINPDDELVFYSEANDQSDLQITAHCVVFKHSTAIPRNLSKEQVTKVSSTTGVKHTQKSR